MQTIKYFPPEPKPHKKDCDCYACATASRAISAIYAKIPAVYPRRASVRLTPEQVKAAFDKCR